MTIDANKINGLLTVILLSSFCSLVLTLAALWFLSKWLEIKESVKNLLEKIDNKVEGSPKSQKLKLIYSDQNTNIQETVAPVETTVSTQKETKPSYAEVLFSDEDSQSVFSTEPTPEVKSSSSKKAVTTDDIKEIIKKRKTKQK